MLQRITLLAASAAAALVLAAGLALAGFGPAAPAADTGISDPAMEPAAATIDSSAPLEAVQVDTVYLEPAPTPEVVVTKVVRETTAGHHDDDEGEHDGDHEGEDD
jgi:hypothetical protein